MNATNRTELMSVPVETRPDAEMLVRSHGFRRLLPVIIVVAAIAVVFGSGLYRQISFESLVRHHAAIEQLVAEHEITAFAAYVGLYVVVVMLSIPGAMVLTVAGGVVFGTLMGALGAIAGATVGATVIFLIARGAVGEILIRRAGPRLAKVAAGFREDAFCYLLFLRLVPLFPFWLVNLVPALAGVRLAPFVGATALGIIPGSLAFAFFGSGLESMIDARKAAYQACLAAGHAECRLGFDVYALATPRVVIAFIILGLFALLPVVVKHVKASRGARCESDSGPA
jgi:uncharacterized membrane protein YdjX (TVP38/TMEM64 family)